jgi:hypothetical protein
MPLSLRRDFEKNLSPVAGRVKGDGLPYHAVLQ